MGLVEIIHVDMDSRVLCWPDLPAGGLTDSRSWKGCLAGSHDVPRGQPGPRKTDFSSNSISVLLANFDELLTSIENQEF